MATNNAGGANGVLMTDMAPDLTTPVSDLDDLPATVNSTAVQLTWSASDVQNDIERFDLQYSLNGGAWTDWAVTPGPADRSAWFIGQPGAYQFRLRTVDAAGNHESFPSAAETAATLNATCANDASEPGNNASAGASGLTPGEVRELVFCQNDTDWVSFQAQAGVEYALLFPSVSGGAAVQARLYNPAGTSILAQGSAPGPGQSLSLRWTAPANGTYLIEMRPANAAVYGSAVRYRVFAGPGKWVYLPLIGR